jgi:hypothetical protein
MDSVQVMRDLPVLADFPDSVIRNHSITDVTYIMYTGIVLKRIDNISHVVLLPLQRIYMFFQKIPYFFRTIPVLDERTVRNRKQTALAGGDDGPPVYPAGRCGDRVCIE